MGVAVVTGGNRGIGLEVGRQLAQRGHEVVLGSRSGDGPRVDGARYEQLDVTDDASVAAFAERVAGVGILVNNAGIIDEYSDHAATEDFAQVRRIIDTNLLGAWRMIQALAPQLREQRGVIANVSTGMAQLSDMGGGAAAYRVSKTALNALTVVTSRELPECRVNAACPGWVQTDMGGPSATRSVPEGAASVVWAATLGPDGPTGGFFRDGQRLDW